MPSPVSPVNPPTYVIVPSTGDNTVNPSLSVAPQQAAGPLMQVVITDSGSMYAPTNATYNVTLGTGSPSGGTGAQATVFVTGNVISGVTITNNGTGYLPGDIVSVPAGTGTPAPLTNTGSIASLIVTYIPTSSPTLELSGVNALNWGSNIWESLYRITESFASPTQPDLNPALGYTGTPGSVIPLVGQLWYDSTTTTLSVCTQVTPSVTWTPLATGGVSSITGQVVTPHTILVNGTSGSAQTGAVTLSLAVTAVTPGLYTNTNLTVDMFGRITAASNGSGGAGSVTSVAASTLTGPISTTGGLVGGTLYTNGTYTNVALTGGHGISAAATVTIAGNTVTTVTVTNTGTGYLVGDTLSALNSSLGGTGSGFSINVTGITSVPKGLQVGGSPITSSGTLSITLGAELQGLSTLTTNGFVQRTGAATYVAASLTSGNITTALGFTPYNVTNPAHYISGNQTITLSGAVTGSGTTSITTTLANSGVTAGTYGNASNIPAVTVNAKGLITSIANVTPAVFTSALQGEVPSSGGGTTNFLRADGTWAPPTGGAQLVAQNGYVTLPGGIIIQWGLVVGSTGAPQVVTFPLKFPTACFTIVATATPSNGTINVSAVNATNFTLQNGASGDSTYWQATGH